MALSILLRRNVNTLQALPKLLNNTKVVINNGYFSKISQTAGKNALLGSQTKFQMIIPKRSMSADHSKLWPIEKAVSIGLLAIVPLTFAVPNILFDNLFAVAAVVHFHWGLEACVADYVRPIIVGPVIPKLTMLLLYIISASTLGGLLYYNFTTPGIGRTFRCLWELKGKDKECKN